MRFAFSLTYAFFCHQHGTRRIRSIFSRCRLLHLVEVMTPVRQPRQNPGWYSLIVEIVPERIVIIFEATLVVRCRSLHGVLRASRGRLPHEDREAAEEGLHGAQSALPPTLSFQLDGVYGHGGFGQPGPFLLLKPFPVFSHFSAVLFENIALPWFHSGKGLPRKRSPLALPINWGKVISEDTSGRRRGWCACFSLNFWR
jgi:hypothetical protein